MQSYRAKLISASIFKNLLDITDFYQNIKRIKRFDELNVTRFNQKLIIQTKYSKYFVLLVHKVATFGMVRLPKDSIKKLNKLFSLIAMALHLYANEC